MRTLQFLLLLTIFLPAVSVAQSDVLTGRITGTDRAPVVGARVTVMSVESEITRSVLTDRNGRYMINFPDGGGRYVLRVQMLGMADVVRTVIREDEELLLTNITMTPQAIQLDAIEVTANRPPPGRGQTGEQTTELSQELLNRLPLPDLDPATLALLSAGVIGTGADSLSGRLGFSVAGMSDLLNQIMLDGVILGEGGLGVPEEGVRNTRVTTSTFDASRGGFAGGQVSMTTSRGNNRTAGSLSYRLDDDALQSRATPLTNAYTRHNIGGSIGGPLLRNKLFYNGSFQLQRNVNHRFALTADDPLAAQRSGVSVDSIARFLNILDSGYGFPTSGQTGAYNQFNEDIRLQGRVDWNIFQRQGQSQTLSARFNLNLNQQDSTRINTLDLAGHGGESTRNNQLAAISLTSRFGTSWTNALNLSFSENWNDALPYIEMPEGQVRVTSDFGDGTRGTRTLVFGGNRNMPTEAYSKDLQLSNDLSFLLPVGAQLHRLKIGGSLQKTRNIDRSTDNLFGAFTFNSLADFEANRPERYERALTERQTRTGVLNAGLYVGDTWRISQPLEITLGLRWDRSVLDQRPAYNPLVEQRFGRRTDIEPVASSFSPRVGFNYRLSQQGQPAKSLTGGIGWFAGRAPTNLYSTAVRQTGLPDAEQRLICIGAATPIPDWDRYLDDPTLVPTSCADGGAGSPVLSSRAPNVTLIDPDQALPSSLRFDLGYRTVLPYRLQGNFRYTYSRGIGLWGYRDINLNEAASFTLANENRPFFGTPNAIVPNTGATSSAGSRIYRDFGTVYDVIADRESSAHQFTGSLSGILPARISAMLNYTLGFARDQGSGSFFAATTAGNPNEVEWATSSNDRRHTINLSMQVPVKPEFELSFTTRLSSGAPFTPLVNRDINGDGARNDRAFIFDPTAAPDSAVANGMTRLLGVLSGRVKSCLEEQLGGIADRNSCRDAWTQSLDLRASFRPNLPRLERRMTISLDGRNVLTGLDQLVHGKDGMRGWGEGQRADNNLLEVRSFDRAANRFVYEVNEGFGQTRRGPNAFRNAFSVTLSARIAIGGQPFQSNRGFGAIPQIAFGGGGPGGGGGGREGFGGGPGGGPGGGLGELMQLFRGMDAATANLDSIMNRAFVNPIPQILARKDTIGMTESQAALLKTISDSLDMKLAVRRAKLRDVTSKLDLTRLIPQQAGGANRGDFRQNMPNIDASLLQTFQLQVQPELSGGQREIAESMREVETALGANWAKVPQRLRNVAGANRANRPGQAGFNATGLLDRMLANPLPVLLALKDTLKLTPEQVAEITKISDALTESLTKRRTDLGKRFDNVTGEQQGRVFQEIQPQIEAARREVTTALGKAEKILAREQWEKVPARVKNPFQNQQMPGQNRRG